MPNSPPPLPTRGRSEARGHEHPGLAIASPVETLLRGLLAANGRRDADARVVEGVRILLGAAWVGLFQYEEGAWLCRSASGEGPVSGEAWTEVGKPGDQVDGPAARLMEQAQGVTAALAVDLQLASAEAVLLVGPSADGLPYAGRTHDLLARITPDLGLALRKGDEIDTLRSQAFVDALTECYNRRGFDEHLHVELRRAQRYARSAALMLVDLDGFKRINDELGHQAGDHVLRRFAALLTGTFRNTDVVSRYGGDEFAVIFPETTSDEAVQLAQRVRSLLSQAFPDAVVARSVSASFGVGAYPEDADSPETLIAAADHALYAAKTGGRDRVVAAVRREDTDR